MISKALRLSPLAPPILWASLIALQATPARAETSDRREITLAAASWLEYLPASAQNQAARALYRSGHHDRSALEDATLSVDLWHRIRQGYALDLDRNDPRIDQELRWFLRNPGYLERCFQRAEPFLHFIIEAAEERGIPLEIALLPVVESAFDPFAYSHARAAGMWQFIPGTGLRYGLKQNWWYDGRRDIVASTSAAFDYLSYLNTFFEGDWEHALAGYNAGEGTVQRSIRRNLARGKPTDFWNLDLPRETRAYVPRLLALARIVRDPEQHGVSLPPLGNEPRITVVDIDDQIDLAQAAQLAGLSVAEIYRYNPGFNRWATDPDGPHRLVLPIDRQTRFEEGYAALPESERVRWERLVVRKGETLNQIARSHRTSVAAIQKANGMTHTRLRAGQTLLIPSAMPAGAPNALLAVNQAVQSGTAKRSKSSLTHVVKRGETVSGIARKHGVSVADLSRWNQLSRNKTIRAGQKLVVRPNADKAKVSQPGGEAQGVRKVGYRIRSGDSLHAIASKFKVSVNDLVRWNTLAKNSVLRPGQQLQIYVN